MSEHMPECPCPTDEADDWYCCATCNPGVTPPWERACICKALRACEARVREDERHWVDKSIRDESYEKGKRMGRHAALRDAAEAVGKMRDNTTRNSVTRSVLNQAVAAIEALGGES